MRSEKRKESRCGVGMSQNRNKARAWGGRGGQPVWRVGGIGGVLWCEVQVQGGTTRARWSCFDRGPGRVRSLRSVWACAVRAQNVWALAVAWRSGGVCIMPPSHGQGCGPGFLCVFAARRRRGAYVGGVGSQYRPVGESYLCCV